MVASKIVPALPEHAEIIAASVRPEDRDELWASTMSPPIEAMTRGIHYSEESYTGMIDDVPVCMWGVVMDSFLTRSGTPWMVGSTDLDRHAMTFLRQCRAPLLEMLGRYDRLENYVDARNKRSIAWLRFMGFTVDKKAEEYGFLKMPFHRFWKESEHHV